MAPPPTSSGRESTGDQRDEAVQLMGIVVESAGTEVGIYNAWIHQQKDKDVVKWENQDSFNHRLVLGDWVLMVWRRGNVTRVTRQNGEPPMKVRECARTGDVLLLASLSLKDADAGKHEKQLWSEDFHSVGLLPYAYIKDMRVGGGTKDMWIAWIKDRGERDKHLQRTGYDVVWKVAFDQGELMYANGRGETRAGADSGVASQITPVTPPQSDSSGESKEESITERVRKRGSFPGASLNRVGIISGHKKGTPFYYVWTPGAPPMKEGQVVVKKVDGEEQIHVCDWIHFRVSSAHEESVFMNRCDDDRFEVIDWEPCERYFPTQLSPNGLTIEVAVRKMIMTSENTKQQQGELYYEDDDFGWVGDRNNHFVGEYPIQRGHVIKFDGVVRRVLPRYKDDSAWMILSRNVTYKGVDDNKKKEKKPPAKEERRGGEDRSNGKEERRDEYQSSGRDDGREDYRSSGRKDRREEYRSNGREEYAENGRGEKKGRKDHYLLQLPRIVGREQGDVIESTAIVEGMGPNGPEAFVWLVDVAASGVVNGGAKYLKVGDVVYGKFRLQRNSKWGSSGAVTPGELPGDMSIEVRKDKVYVTAQIIFDAERDEYRNPWFETVFDMERKMPRDPVDKEVYLVELTKVRNGFNINKLLNY